MEVRVAELERQKAAQRNEQYKEKLEMSNKVGSRDVSSARSAW